MIKLTFCLRRRDGLSRAEFQEYWRTVHAPKVRARASALGVRRYVQVHTEDLQGLHDALVARNGGAPEPYDGIAELWFDDAGAFAVDDAGARAAGAELLADEREFIELARSPMTIGVEHEIVSPASGPRV